jgi:hypothetical protein
MLWKQEFGEPRIVQLLYQNYYLLLRDAVKSDKNLPKIKKNDYIFRVYIRVAFCNPKTELPESSTLLIRVPTF